MVEDVDDPSVLDVTTARERCLLSFRPTSPAKRSAKAPPASPTASPADVEAVPEEQAATAVSPPGKAVVTSFSTLQEGTGSMFGLPALSVSGFVMTTTISWAGRTQIYCPPAPICAANHEHPLVSHTYGIGNDLV